MKILVAYYSLGGNTKFIAETIAQEIGADILALKLKKEISSKGFMKYFWGGRQAIMKKEPELLPLDKDATQYDVIFIGTPIWAWTFTPPIRTFFSQVKLKGKKIALFTTSEGGAGKTFNNMKEKLSGNEFIGELDLTAKGPEEQQKNANKAKDWAKQVLGH